MAITIGWLTAFVDRPAPTFEAATAFWLAVTESTLSPRRGATGQFATLVPGSGDAIPTGPAHRPRSRRVPPRHPRHRHRSQHPARGRPRCHGIGDRRRCRAALPRGPDVLRRRRPGREAATAAGRSSPGPDPGRPAGHRCSASVLRRGARVLGGAHRLAAARFTGSARVHRARPTPGDAPAASDTAARKRQAGPASRRPPRSRLPGPRRRRSTSTSVLAPR